MSRQDQLREILNKKKAAAESRADATSDKPAAAAPKKGEPIAYFDSARSGYWHKNARGEWIPFTEASLRRILKYNHYHETTDKEAQFAMIDKHFIRLQQEHDVAYAGAIAGFRSGLHEICGQRVLVTSGPRLIRPVEKDWPLFHKFITELLGENSKVFFCWMKAALRTLYAGPPFRPGQMMAIAGDGGCGKSLLQNLITVMLGGRSAKPYRYMIGDTSFNSDLFQNEHLMIEDEAASTDLRIRRHFGSQLKNMIANEVQSLHRKGRDALSISPFWRVTITLNDEPENLMVLPPLDESLRDKITLMRAKPATFPYGPDDLAGRNKYYASIVGELPGFIHFLRGYRIPDRWLNQRYGVAAFQDADLLRELEDLAPESRLLTLIDTLYIWGIDRTDWTGTSVELEDLLLEKDKLGRVAKLLSYNTACGVYLARLKNRCPERVSEKRDGRHSRMWCIRPPSK